MNRDIFEAGYEMARAQEFEGVESDPSCAHIVRMAERIKDKAAQPRWKKVGNFLIDNAVQLFTPIMHLGNESHHASDASRHTKIIIKG